MIAEKHRNRGAALCCLTAIAATCGAGCVREPVEEICPAVGPGDLVVTEIRGSQSGADTYGQWIEIHNTTNESFDLRGLKIRMYRLDGGGELILLLRDDEVPIDAQQYVVVGHHDPARLPSFVDTTIFADYSSKSTDGHVQPRSLYTDAVIELIACGTEIDRMFYRDLPTAGTFALDGAQKPTAEANDDPDSWCTDDNEPDDDGPQTEVGLRGTPGEANPPCP